MHAVSADNRDRSSIEIKYDGHKEKAPPLRYGAQFSSTPPRVMKTARPPFPRHLTGA